MKVGRVKFAVKDVGIEGKMKVDVEEDEFLEFEEVESIMNQDGNTQNTDNGEEQMYCRFCYLSEATESNPLFCSCKCSGSVGYVHFECLKKWQEVKKTTKASANFSSLYWKAFECEICKKAYPLMIKSQGKTYSLVEYERPTGNYLVLESLNQEKNTSRIIHIIKPGTDKDVFKLGRGHESDLRINDISVSRCHAHIKLKDERFLLEDNTSKFGTLVLLKNRTPLVPGFNKAVQIGRTVINFSVKPVTSRLVDEPDQKLLTSASDPRLTDNKQLVF